MLYKVHRHLESFLTFYYEHAKSHKTLVKHEQKQETQQLQGSKGGKVVKVIKRKKSFNYDINNYGIETIF